jgi:hypothetical protein
MTHRWVPDTTSAAPAQSLNDHCADAIIAAMEEIGLSCYQSDLGTHHVYYERERGDHNHPPAGCDWCEAWQKACDLVIDHLVPALIKTN